MTAPKSSGLIRRYLLPEAAANAVSLLGILATQALGFERYAAIVSWLSDNVPYYGLILLQQIGQEGGRGFL